MSLPTPAQINELRNAIAELKAATGEDLGAVFTGASTDANILKTLLNLINDKLRDINNEANYLDSSFKRVITTMKNMLPTQAAHYQGMKRLNSVANELLDIKRGEQEMDFKTAHVGQDKIKQAKEYLNFEKAILEQKLKDLKASQAIEQQAVNAARTQNRILLQNRQISLATFRDRYRASQDELQSIVNNISRNETKIKLLKEQIGQANYLNNQYNKVLETHIKTNKELGLMGNSVKGLDALTKNMGFDLGFESAYKDTLKAAQAAEVAKDKYAALKKERITDPTTGQERRRTDAEIQQIMGDKDFQKATKPFDTMAHFTDIINQNITGLLDPFKLIQKAVLKFYETLVVSDKATGELAKSFGISYAEAASLRNELSTISNISTDINVNVASLQKALTAINKEFGTAAMLSGELLKDYTRLTEVAGYSAEAAAGLSKITVATGTDLSKNTESILGQAVAFNATNKLALNEKEIVEGVAKASAATTLSLGMQSGKIAEAVLQAKALGTTLQQVEQIANSLLQFESSIEAELSAELLIGRDLYMERARLYALNNDLAGVAREINREVGSAADFTNMNVIQQEAIAKAVGMQREDLAKALIEQEALAKIGKGEKTALEAYNRLKKEGLSDDAIAAKLGDEKLAQQLASQSIQERFAKSVEKLQEVFVALAEPVLQIVSPFMDLVTTILPLINILLTPIMGIFKFIGESVQFFAEGVKIAFNAISELIGIFTPAIEMWKEFKKENEGLFKVFSAIGGVLKFIVGFLTTALIIEKSILLINTLISKQKLLAIGSTIKTIALERGQAIIDIGKAGINAFTRMVKDYPYIGIGLGVAAAASAVALGNKYLQGNDIISPGSGYGKRTLLAPEGAIALNDKDTVIAGTKLFRGNDVVSTDNKNINIPSPSISNSPKSPQPVLVQVAVNNSYDGTQFETIRNISRRQIQ